MCSGSCSHLLCVGICSKPLIEVIYLFAVNRPGVVHISQIDAPHCWNHDSWRKAVSAAVSGLGPNRDLFHRRPITKVLAPATHFTSAALPRWLERHDVFDETPLSLRLQLQHESHPEGQPGWRLHYLLAAARCPLRPVGHAQRPSRGDIPGCAETGKGDGDEWVGGVCAADGPGRRDAVVMACGWSSVLHSSGPVSRLSRLLWPA